MSTPLFSIRRPLPHVAWALLLALLSFGAAQAQQHGGGHPRSERLEAARVAYITEKLALTTDQSQRFWPLYNEFTDKRRSLRKQARGEMRNQDVATMSDKDLRESINNQFAMRQSELNLEKEYLDKFQKVITLRQVALLYQAERDFTKELLKRLDGRPAMSKSIEQ
ncbi:hypothetical protein F0P96_16625 [Hymenobacter busanensis]|uniref:Uncharacterized protein n=1 Tax=Hymenobacter busanensis TaxID=2607656 RepID=A0A7L4ZSJ7_9BACT|nr:hypothetical protein [Hymenobacter busanensis]KAA9327603.1 hypothetical protein F0P96_16625 [Hymenobacter busanensis]QHJ06058.1 hypothetical protein GUY19_01610 [Hymenobacter busanensis]